MRKKQGSGTFIVVEGADGTGSTTQARLLAERLRASHDDVTLTCEPTAGPIGTLIRQVLSHRLVVPSSTGPRAPDWRTMALLFAADRADHVDCVIAPAMARGGIVVSDRYVLSSLAYQSLTADIGAAALPWLRTINSMAVCPDLTLVLTTSAELAAQRRSKRGEAEELYEANDLQTRLAHAYEHASDLLPNDVVAIVPADEGVDEVATKVWHAVTERLPLAST